MTVLLLLGLPWTWSPAAFLSPSHWLDYDSLWGSSPAPARICWSGILLVVWLWLNHRTQLVLGRPGGVATTVGLVASAILVLLVAWAVLASARSSPVPNWELIQIHP